MIFQIRTAVAEDAAGAALKVDLIRDVEEAIDGPVVTPDVGEGRMSGAR